MATRSIYVPKSDHEQKVVVKTSTGHKVKIHVIAPGGGHLTASLIPNGSVELYEANVLKAKKDVGSRPENVDFCPAEPPAPPPPENFLRPAEAVAPKMRRNPIRVVFG